MPWSRVARAKLTSRRTDRSQLPVLSFPGCQKEMRGRSQTRLRPLFRLNRFAMDFISMRASARTRVTFDYEIHPCISPFGPTASPLFKFAPSEFSRQKSPKPFAPGRHPTGSLRSSAKPAQKELASFAGSDTFLLYPALPAVLGGRPVAVGGLFMTIKSSTRGSLLTRRASQPVTGEAKRCLRSVSDEFFSRRERREAQSSRRPR